MTSLSQNTDDKLNTNLPWSHRPLDLCYLSHVLAVGASVWDWKLFHVPLSCWLLVYGRKGAIVVTIPHLGILRHRELPAMLASQMIMVRHLYINWDCLCMCLFKVFLFYFLPSSAMYVFRVYCSDFCQKSAEARGKGLQTYLATKWYRRRVILFSPKCCWAITFLFLLVLWQFLPIGWLYFE